MTDLVLFGTGDFARIARVYLEQDSPHDVIAFTVNEEYIDGADHARAAGRPVRVARGDVTRPIAARCSSPPASARSTRSAPASSSSASKRGYELVTYVCSKAIHWGPQRVRRQYVHLRGERDPALRDDRRRHRALERQPHRPRLDDRRPRLHRLARGVSGNVTIGDYCFVGVNATFRDGITVAPRCVIGAGALIMKDTEEGAVYAVRGTEPLEQEELGPEDF